MSDTTPSLRSTPSPPPLPRKRESGAGATERLTTDVLVIGGGLAGLWAAIRAREQGQRVLIVEKGFAGASGCSVFAGAVVLCLTPDDDLDTFIAEESQDADYLLDPEWAEFVVRDNYERLREIVAWGGPIPVDADGQLIRRRGQVHGRHTVARVAFDSAELMKFMRKVAIGRRKAKTLDQTVVTNLLVEDGQVVGAVALRRQEERVTVICAQAVVLAAGGCSWRGTHFGHDMVCGEAYKLAWDVGAELMSMEFGNGYMATYRHADTHGQCLLAAIGGKFINKHGETFIHRYSPRDPAPTHLIPRAMAGEVRAGRGPIRYDLTGIPPAAREQWKRDFALIWRGMERTGIDAFDEPREWFPGFNGTVSASAGVRLLDRSGATTVPGLYAAGDAASRSPLIGAGSGITFLNLAWAGVSGAQAGIAAAQFSQRHDAPAPSEASVSAAVAAAVAPQQRNTGATSDGIYRRLQEQVIGMDANIYRHGDRLREMLAATERVRDRLLPVIHAADWHELVKCHETIATCFTTELMYRAALLREESRGWHYREAFPARDDERWRVWLVAAPQRSAGPPALWAAPEFRRLPVPLEAYAARGIAPTPAMPLPAAAG